MLTIVMNTMVIVGPNALTLSTRQRVGPRLWRAACFGVREPPAEAAAELYESIDAFREAVNCYIAGEARLAVTTSRGPKDRIVWHIIRRYRRAW